VEPMSQGENPYRSVAPNFDPMEFNQMEKAIERRFDRLYWTVCIFHSFLIVMQILYMMMVLVIRHF
jgi:uncharacterized membrane protein YidH (DUF202 family)